VERGVDEAGHPRWGSGEARVTAVELFGGDGMPVERLVSGSPATIRLRYEMHEPIAQPVFACYITTINGQPVSAPNTRASGCVPDKLDGSGHVDIALDEVRLLPGTYELTPVISDITMMKVFDHRQNVRRFDVERGSIGEEWGVTTLSPRWEIVPEG
jgi:hypothetical protein